MFGKYYDIISQGGTLGDNSDMNDIALNREDITALSSDVRIAILKALDDRSGNSINDLAGELDLAKSTVHQHLGILMDSGLIKMDGSRKWRTYSLTSKAQHILHPEKGYRILLLLGTSIFTLTTGLFFIHSYVCGYTVQDTSTIHDPLMLIIGELLLILTIALWYTLFRLRKAKKRYSI